MFLMLAVSSSSKRARGASNFNSEILPAMSLIIELAKPSEGRWPHRKNTTEIQSRKDDPTDDDGSFIFYLKADVQSGAAKPTRQRRQTRSRLHSSNGARSLDRTNSY